MNARRVIGGAITALVIVASWVFLAPTQLGGGTTYVTTHGISMQPRFHTGDLAILRPARTYRVGDVVGYRSAVMHTVVMHRIVGISNGRYTFKGDNNSWLDPERPTRGRLIGALTLRIPNGGTWLGRIASPPGLGLLALAIFATGSTAVQTRRSRRRRGTVSRHAAPRIRRPASRLGSAGAFDPSRIVIAVSGLLGTALAVLAWSTPQLTSRVVSASQTASLTFSYTAAVPKTAAYDGTVVASPDPIFRRVTNVVDVHYIYRGQPAAIRVDAQLSAASGWHSTLPLARSSADRVPGQYEGAVKLDLSQLYARARAAAAVTGEPVDQLAVDVTADIVGPAGEFTPTLPLTLTPLALSLRGDPHELTVTHTTTRPHRVPVDRSFGLGSRRLTVVVARKLSLGLLICALLGAATVTLNARRHPAGASEAEGIRRRYVRWLVAAQPVGSSPGRPVIDVDEFKTLVRIAERYGLLILHWSRSGVHTFVIEDDGATYRYRIGAVEPSVV